MFDSAPPPTVRSFSTAQLRHDGIGRRAIADAVHEGALVRVRRGRFVAPDVPSPILAAARLGARLDCISRLRRLGVFVQDHARLHVQVAPTASRLPACPDDATRHWRPSDAGRDDLEVPITEALAQAIRCQSPRAAIATLDSAWHRGLVDEADLAEVFALVPRRHRRLRPLLDRRAESGIETLVRLMLRALGYRAELQVRIRGVGRVDLLVDGWLIIECDSEEFHGSWEDHRRDRRRDAAAIALGYTPLRLLTEDVLYHPDLIIGWLRAALAQGPRADSRSSTRRPRPCIGRNS
ncbi:hypothetical protein [Microbacterium sp. bgisy189]|uniref:hypothetical protein n=1 Tax=Microbacterium sp. bgisy189 TaxID=3413798 RepID=UPI003EBB281D